MVSEKALLKLINKEKKKEGKFSKRVVALVIFLNVIFASAVLYVFLKTGSEPTALVVAWFAFTTGELWLLSGIKKKEMQLEEEDCNDGDVDNPLG